MQRLLFILFISFFLVVSCAKQKPSGVLSEQKMTEMLTEVSLIDAYLNTLPIDSGRKVMPVLYANLFKDFDIDSAQFKKNLDFYYGNPKLTEKIYTNVNSKLVGYEKKYQVEDSVRNAFLQDSISRVSRLQELSRKRYNLIMNFYKDTTVYTYHNNGMNFYSHTPLNLSAYGIQIPALPSSPMNAMAVEPILQDSVFQKYLLPVEKLLLNQPKDTATFDFRKFAVYFLEQADLHVRSGYLKEPFTKMEYPLGIDNTTKMPLDSAAVDTLSARLPRPIEEQPVVENVSPTIPKKLQIEQQRK